MTPKPKKNKQNSLYLHIKQVYFDTFQWDKRQIDMLNNNFHFIIIESEF